MAHRFVSLLGPLTAWPPKMALVAWWIVSVAATLLGIIATHARVPALEEHQGTVVAQICFWVSVALSVPLLAFVMGDMLPGQPLRHGLSSRLIAWLQLVLATPVVLWGGWGDGSGHFP